MEEIFILYQQSLTNDTQVTLNATKRLLSIYENPSNIQLLIQVINEAPDSTIRRSALAGLLKMMQKHWSSSFDGNQNGEIIKQQLLIILQKYQNDNQLSNLLVSCFYPILQKQGWAWNDLINFITQSISEATIEIVSYLLECNIKNPEKLNPEIINFCLLTVQKSINTNNVQIIICSSKIFALLSSFLPQQYSEVLSNFMNVYISLFASNPDITLAKSISKSFNINNAYFDANKLLIHLLELSTKLNPRIYFITIRKLVSKFGKSLRNNFPLLLQTTINIISSLFTNDCYDTDTDSNFIASIGEKCLKKCNMPDFCALILQILSTPTKSIEGLYAILEILHNIIDELDLTFPSLFDTIMAFLSKSLTVDNHVIIELSIECIIDTANSTCELFENTSEKVFKSLLPLINSKHQPIVFLSLRALALILFDYNLSSNFLNPLVPLFIQTAGQTFGTSKALLILVICGFVSRLQDEIEPFVPSILPLVISCTNDSDEEVQQRVIETLGFILMNAPGQCGSIIEQSMNLFVKSLDRDDLVSSSFLSLTNVAKSPLKVDPFIEMGVIRACQIAAPGEEDEWTGLILENIQSAITFLNAALKFRPEACKRWKLLIIGCCLANMSDEVDDDVLEEATMSIMRALDGVEIAPQIFETLLLNAESKNKFAARATFKAASFLVKNKSNSPVNNSEVNNGFITKMMQLAIDAIKRELPCQKSEKNDAQILANYDSDLFDVVIKFLCNFAIKRPNVFPSAQLLSLIISLKGKVSKYETEFCLAPFVFLKLSTQQQPNEIDSQLFEFAFLLASENCITKWPFSILRLILLSNNSAATHVQQIVALCSNRINDSLSALALLFFLASKQCFPVQQAISDMINCIPEKGELDDLSIIWNCLFTISQQFPGIEQPFINIIVLKGAATINRYKDNLPKDLTNIIMQFIRSAVQNNQQLATQLSSYPYVCKLMTIQ